MGRRHTNRTLKIILQRRQLQVEYVKQIFGRCFRNRLLSGWAMRVTTTSFGCTFEARTVVTDLFFNSGCLEILSDKF
jgi:hypothetical protein